MIISSYVDNVLLKVLKKLGIELPEYTKSTDPTKQKYCDLEWTILPEDLKAIEKIYNVKIKENTKKRKSNSYNNESVEHDVKKIVKVEKKEEICIKPE